MADEIQLERAGASLRGLVVGDSFGETFFGSLPTTRQRIAARTLPRGPWQFTDDSVMAFSVVQVLQERRGIDQDRLARLFADRYAQDPVRGYGSATHTVLNDIGAGVPWQRAAARSFNGAGSMGNGAAMRVAPIGAYFCEDYSRVVEHARRSAEVTHSHPEAAAGAVAVGIAAACAARGVDDVREFFETVLLWTPASETRRVIELASSLDRDDATPEIAAAMLGSGQQVISQDTVPFCLWCASRNLGDFAEAMWATVAGLGDRDTTCAIVGGIVAANPRVTVPRSWLDSCEPADSFYASGPL